MQLNLKFPKYKKHLGFTDEDLQLRYLLENHSSQIPVKKQKYNLVDLFADKEFTELLKPKSKKVTKRKNIDFEAAIKILYSITANSKLDRPLDYIFYDKKNKGFICSNYHILVFYPDLQNERKYNFYYLDKNRIAGRDEISDKFPDYEAVVPTHTNSVKNIDLKEFIEKIYGIIETFKYTVNVPIIKIIFGETEIYFEVKNLFDFLNVLYQFDTQSIDIYYSNTSSISPLLVKDIRNPKFFGLVMPTEPETSSPISFIEPINFKSVKPRNNLSKILLNELNLLTN
jgi:hypothetical protein